MTTIHDTTMQNKQLKEQLFGDITDQIIKEADINQLQRETVLGTVARLLAGNPEDYVDVAR